MSKSLLTTRFERDEFVAVLRTLAASSAALEGAADWPESQLRELARAGVLGWVVPTAWGGGGLSSVELMAGYERLARACLVTTFVLTQQDAACQRIAAAENDRVKAELLPGICRGELFATVGISHLTTSRQHLQTPAVQARRAGVGFVLNGRVPWVTGGTRADYLVTGGTCEDWRQILAVVRTAADGVTVEPPPRLLALNASQTGPVELRDVEVPDHYVLAGPAERIMSRGKSGGAGSLTTSALALGAAAASLARLADEMQPRPELAEIHAPLAAEHAALHADLLAAAAGESVETNPNRSAESIRQRANSLVLRCAQAYLAASKGAGFVEGHPAGRAVREAIFFLVWSCPQPVLTAALREFACVSE